MNNINSSMVLSLLIAAICFVGTPGASLADVADNTKINERDSLEGQMTADKQGESESDLNITQAVRKAIINDKTLSTYAHNVKVITNNGLVTLKGPVRSAQEKTQVENLASYVVGMGNVQTQLDIAAE